MEISQLIGVLEQARDDYGEIDVQVQRWQIPKYTVETYSHFVVIITERDGGPVCYIKVRPHQREEV